MYRLFIDDERDPVADDWIVARTSHQAFGCILEYGMPYEIAFDHDLGVDDTSMVFIYMLIDYMMDNNIEFPQGFTYSIHSQNPVGVQNIDSLMKSFIQNLNCG